MNNLKLLFEIQGGLDAHILKNHPIQDGENRFFKKILALEVEIGECANELPEVFKFWSNKKNNYEKALEELVDCVHFFLSIGLDLKVKEHVYSDITPANWDDLGKQFRQTFLWIGKMSENPCPTSWKRAFKLLLGIAELLGFTPEQIEEAYLEKNRINHQRQLDSY